MRSERPSFLLIKPFPRGPQDQYMLRIGKVRDGSKVGVFFYCQEHGNEIATSGVCLETAERLTVEEREPSIRLYLLVVGALRALAEGAHTPTLVLDAFILRAMTTAGYEPALEACARDHAVRCLRWRAIAAGQQHAAAPS